MSCQLQYDPYLIFVFRLLHRALAVENEDGTVVKLKSWNPSQREAVAKQLLTPKNLHMAAFGQKKVGHSCFAYNMQDMYRGFASIRSRFCPAAWFLFFMALDIEKNNKNAFELWIYFTEQFKISTKCVC